MFPVGVEEPAERWARRFNLAVRRGGADVSCGRRAVKGPAQTANSISRTPRMRYGSIRPATASNQFNGNLR
jgi:hypothetical protein